MLSFSAADSDGVSGFDATPLAGFIRGEDGAEEPLALALLSDIGRRFVGFAPLTCHCEVMDLLSELPGSGKSMLTWQWKLMTSEIGPRQTLSAEANGEDAREDS